MTKEPVVVEQGRAETLDVMGAQVSFLCPAQATGRAWSLIEVTAPKDAGPPPHEHPWDEAYYVLAGSARFQVGDRHLVVHQGDFLYAPGGTVHAFQGASEEPARLLIFDAPAAAEAFFRDAAAEIQEMPRDLQKVPGIGARHRIRFLPPQAA
jgi:quercetin dioxygenase-like cupin family protein